MDYGGGVFFAMNRSRSLNNKKTRSGKVVYWSTREHRFRDNWTLILAAKQAEKINSELDVVVCLRKDLTPIGTARMLDFMIGGIEDMESKLLSNNIGFSLLLGEPVEQLERYVKDHEVGQVYVDFYPIKPYSIWNDLLSKKIDVSLIQVDAHNIVPCWMASEKQEYAARTFRPKIKNLLDEYLVSFPSLPKLPPRNDIGKPTDWKAARQAIKVDESVKVPGWMKPGSKNARKCLIQFITHKLSKYHKDRNDPSLQGISNLSPYLHFGQISPHRVALEIKKARANKQAKEAFLEELIIRRELADNYCFYNKNYNNFDGFPDWAKNTLRDHNKDERQYLYSYKELENAATHDEAWNASQREMVTTGKMHGYMRMYWAKKILEWTHNAKTAQSIAIRLNDIYQLDGRDPNGYTGISWSMGGVHDRPWFEREIFGKIRYMNQNGLRRKFDLQSYIYKFSG